MTGDIAVRSSPETMSPSATSAAWHRGIIKHHNIDTQGSDYRLVALNIRGVARLGINLHYMARLAICQQNLITSTKEGK